MSSSPLRRITAGPSSPTRPSASTPPRPSRGIKRRLPPDLTPLVERTPSYKSHTQRSSREQDHDSAPSTTTSDGSGGALSTSKRKSNKSKDLKSSANGSAPLHDNSPIQEAEEAVDEDQRKRTELFEGWKDEYFEIIEQLPLEMHRSFSLIRELDSQVRTHMETIRRETLAYRDYRLAHSQQKSGRGHSQDIPNGPIPKVINSSSENTHSGSPISHQPSSPNGAGAASESQLQTKGTPLAHSQFPGSDSHPQGAAHGVEQTSSSSAAGSESYRRHPSLAQVSQACSSAIAASEEKVGLALSVYQLIDRQCRRLDADLAKAAAASKNAGDSGGSPDAVEHIRTGTLESRKSQKLGGGAVATSEREHGRSQEKAAHYSSRAKKRSLKSQAAEGATAGIEGNSANDAIMAAIDDSMPNMAVDPNEPVYCYCRGPSYGLMVGCDNDDCPYEWFHLACLGLDKPPGETRQWFCQDCAKGTSGSGARDSKEVTAAKHKVGKNVKKVAAGRSMR